MTVSNEAACAAGSASPLDAGAGGASWRKAFWAFVILTVVAFMARLGEGDLGEDPAQYAAVAKDMVQTGEYITLRTMDQLYFNKPPLYFWLTAGLFKLVGFTAWAARFWSAALGAGCVFLLYDIVRRFRGRDEALLAGLALLTTNDFLRNGVSGRLDTPLTFFFLLAFWGLTLRLTTERKWTLLLVGLSVGLAGLTKGTICIIGLMMFLLGIVFGARRLLLSGWLWFGILLGAAVCASWHLAVAAANPQFWDIYVGREVATRIKGGGEWTEPTPKLAFFLKYVFSRGMPWSLLGLLGIFATPLLLRDKKTRPYVIMWLVWFGALLYAALISKKLYFRYFVPVCPALCAFSAVLVLRFLPGAWWEKAKRALPTVCAAAMLGLLLLPIPRHSQSNEDLAAIVPTLDTLQPKGEKLYAYRVDSSVIHQFYGTISWYCDRPAVYVKDIGGVADAAPAAVLGLSETPDDEAALRALGYVPAVRSGELILYRKADAATNP